MTPDQRQRVADEMHRHAKLHGYSTYRVKIELPDGQTDLQIVEAEDEWKARTMAMMLTSVRANGQTVSYEVERL